MKLSLLCLSEAHHLIPPHTHTHALQFFCWHCGQATGQAHTYGSIANHSCGRYKEEADKRINEAQRNHKRYMHYFERWKGHVDSLVKEATNRCGDARTLEHYTVTGSWPLIAKASPSRPFSYQTRRLTLICPLLVPNVLPFPFPLRTSLLIRIDNEIQSGTDARDYGWLVRALDQLKVARGVLAPTYPFAYIFFGEWMRVVRHMSRGYR